MALIQQVKDGKFIDETTGTGSTSTKSSEKDKKTNELGYDQFLQILCAESFWLPEFLLPTSRRIIHLNHSDLICGFCLFLFPAARPVTAEPAEPRKDHS